MSRTATKRGRGLLADPLSGRMGEPSSACTGSMLFVSANSNGVGKVGARPLSQTTKSRRDQKPGRNAKVRRVSRQHVLAREILQPRLGAKPSALRWSEVANKLVKILGQNLLTIFVDSARRGALVDLAKGRRAERR